MKYAAILVILVLVGLAGSSVIYAQSGGGYDLTWSTIDNGGATVSSGGGYSLGGTIGQPDAGTLSGGGYTLLGGFWGGETAAAPGVKTLYLPIILKGG